jgi:hypothetical protein
MMATQDFGGLLFGMGGSGLEDYLTPEQTQGIQNQAMLQAAAALLQAGGPSARPVSLGQALGGALQAGQQGYSQAQTGAINTLMSGQKLREAKTLADIRSKMAADEASATPAAGMTPEDAKFNTYMKYSQLYTQAGNLDEAKKLQDMAYQIKPRAEVTGTPFEVTGIDNKPLLVQQMKDGTIKTVEGFGPKRDIVLQNLGGRTVAIDKSKLTGNESFAQTLAPQVVGGAEGGYYVVGGGGGAAPATAGGGQRTAAPTPPVGTTIMRPNYVPPNAAQVAPQANVTPAAVGPVPIIAGTGPKPTEQYNKMALGVLNTSNAVNNFTSKLEGFSSSDMVDPARRAELNSAHSNAMLQAKELYNLGVLTGGDEEILNKVLANPVDFKSALTPVSAIKKQADDLQTVINNANKNLSTVFKQPELKIPKAPEKQADKPVALQEGATAMSKSGKPMIVRNGIWEYVK